LRIPPGKQAPITAGYLHPDYCRSLSEFGTSRLLPECGGWILERQIPDSQHVDAMGCYPLFQCQDWSRLQHDLESVGNGLVSVTVVTDALAECDQELLRRCFPDLCAPFKEHFVVDLTRQLETFVHPHHRRNARKAQRAMSIERCASPIDFLDEWVNLYAVLVRRHQITGISAFSRAAFAKQLVVPGIEMFRATHEGMPMGIVLWYRQGSCAYYHLGAYSDKGYELGASFGLFDFAIKHFADAGTEWLNLGSSAGVSAAATDGLGRFKKGWSTGVRTAYLCGRILDRPRYDELVETRGVGSTNYFPAYRAGEFS